MALVEMFQEELYNIPQPVVVIIDQPWQDVSEAGRQLLAKILGAIELRPGQKLSLQAVQVVNQTSLQIDQLVGAPEFVIAFTSVPSGVPLYEVMRTPDKQVVASEPLHKLISSDDGKKRLWQALRAQFGMGGKPS